MNIFTKMFNQMCELTEESSNEAPPYPLPTYEVVPYPGYICVLDPWEGLWCEIPKHDNWEEWFDPIFMRA